MGVSLIAPLAVIDGAFPFSKGNATTPRELLEEVMSGAMELKAVVELMSSSLRTNTMYLGAAHAFRVFYLLKHHYNWSTEHAPFESDFQNLHLMTLDGLQNCVVLNK